MFVERSKPVTYRGITGERVIIGRPGAFLCFDPVDRNGVVRKTSVHDDTCTYALFIYIYIYLYFVIIVRRSDEYG